jgi:hypothetical protein
MAVLEPGCVPGSRVEKPGCGRGWWIPRVGWLLGLALCVAKPASAVPIHGQVISAEGRPLHGAEVALAPIPSLLTSPAGVEDVKASVVADERGDFVLDAPGPGMWRLRLSAPGHRAAVCDILPLLDALEIPPVTLPRAASAAAIIKASPPRIRCRLADAVTPKGTADPASGRPVELRLLAPDEKPAAGVKALLEDGTVHGPSDTSGRLQVDFPGAQPMGARFWNADSAWAAALLQPPGPGAPPDRLVRLQPAAIVTGTVLDRTTRRPLPQALVWPTADPGRANWTDGNGRFTLRVPFLDAPALQAAAAGYQVATARSDRSASEGLIVSLAPAATVAGLVVDEAGRPVPGAEIETVPVEVPLPTGEVSGWSRTDSQGRFRLDGLRSGERLTARVLASGFAVLESPMPPLAPEPATPVRLALQRGRTVLGKVVDAAGSPIQGAEILAYPLDPAAQPESLFRAKAREMRSTTGRDGTFSLPAVGAGQIDLSLRAAGAGPKWLRAVDVPSGNAPLDLGRIVLGPESPLRGTVADDVGAPIAGARVTAVPVVTMPRPGDFTTGPPPATLTDAAGQFALSGLEAGVKVLLQGEQDGFLPATQEVELADDPEPVLLTLKPAEALRGSVVDEEAGPVEGARIILITQHAAHGDRRRPLATSMSDRLGAFTFAAVPAGSHQLAVQAAGYLAWSQPLTVDSESPPKPVEVQLEHGAALSGRILSERGQPIEGAKVSLKDEGPMLGLSPPGTISDAEGVYWLEGLPVGPQQVQVLHQDYLPEQQQLQLDETGTTRDFKLRSGAGLAGQVVDDRNEPVAGAMVSLVAEENLVAVEPRWTDAEGRFRATGLAPGRYSVLVEQAGYAPVEKTGVEVGSRAPDLLIRLDSGATLFGQIHGLRAEERSRLQVWATGPARVQVPGTVDGEGRYRIPNLGAGAWRVSARAEGLGREVSAPLNLAPDQREAFLDLEFATGYALAGAVTRGENAVEGALVSVQGLAGESAGAVTGPQGRFRVEPLIPGKYRVVVLDRATGAQGSWTLDLDNDLETVFDLPASAQAAKPLDEP